MNIYCVYNDSSKNQDELIIVKEGFSIYAAVFNLLWALYHKMWLVVLIGIIVSLCAMPLEKLGLYYLYDMTILLIFSFFASDIRGCYATRSGYVLADVVTALDEEEAELKYYYKQTLVK
jgi:hypothetical protein